MPHHVFGHPGVRFMFHFPTPAFCLIDAGVLIGSVAAVVFGVVDPRQAPFNWDGLNGFLLQVSGIITAITLLFVKVLELYAKVVEGQAKVAESQANHQDNLAKIRELQTRADSAEKKVTETAVEVQRRVEAAKAETTAAARREADLLREQLRSAEAVIVRVRQRQHEQVDLINKIHVENEARKIATPDPDAPLKVEVVNPADHPVPVVGPPQARPGYEG